jgi:hypothetical protein
MTESLGFMIRKKCRETRGQNRGAAKQSRESSDQIREKLYTYATDYKLLKPLSGKGQFCCGKNNSQPNRAIQKQTARHIRLAAKRIQIRGNFDLAHSNFWLSIIRPLSFYAICPQLSLGKKPNHDFQNSEIVEFRF